MNACISWNFISVSSIPAGIYLLKVSNRNTRTRCEIFSKFTVKAPGRRQRRQCQLELETKFFIVQMTDYISH